MEGEAPAGRSLALTPTWAIAAVCSVMAVVSFAAERIIHHLGLWLKERKQKAWRQALERMKEELMLLGFMSLAITVSQNYIIKICLPARMLTEWTPCAANRAGSGPTCQPERAPLPSPTRELLERDYGLSQLMRGRLLTVEESRSDPCQGACGEGHQPVISQEGIHQLHIFVFVLAFVHVFLTALTVGLSMLKIHWWRKWEDEAHAENHDNHTEISNNSIFNTRSTFVRLHAMSNNRFGEWISCFFRQFFTSVTRADYLALRLGFLANHSFDKAFNFHSYMVRTLEEEFKEVVGISAYLWAFVVCFLLFNVHGTNLYFWVALIPPVLLLMIGTKLQHAIANLALENGKIPGPPLSRKIRPRVECFWLKNPELLLGLIHFILFQNAFELAMFFWTWTQFSLSSCFLEHKAFNVVRLGLGFLVQIVSSYSTLPLYALASQMGSNYKVGDNVKAALHRWRNRVKQRSDSEKAGRSSRGQFIFLPTSRTGESEEDLQGSEDNVSRDESARDQGSRIRVSIDEAGESRTNFPKSVTQHAYGTS